MAKVGNIITTLVFIAIGVITLYLTYKSNIIQNLIAQGQAAASSGAGGQGSQTPTTPTTPAGNVAETVPSGETVNLTIQTPTGQQSIPISQPQADKTQAIVDTYLATSPSAVVPQKAIAESQIVVTGETSGEQLIKALENAPVNVSDFGLKSMSDFTNAVETPQQKAAAKPLTAASKSVILAREQTPTIGEYGFASLKNKSYVNLLNAETRAG